MLNVLPAGAAQAVAEGEWRDLERAQPELAW